MPAPVTYRSHWPRPTLANRSTMTAAPANLAPPAPIKVRPTKPESIQSAMRRPVPEAAGRPGVVVIRFPPDSRKSPMYIDTNILDVDSLMPHHGKGMQNNARHVWGACLVGALEGVSRPGGSGGGELEPEPDGPRRVGFPDARSAAPQGTVAGQYDWSQSMAHAGIDQCRGRSAREDGAGETEEYRRPARAPGRTHGERARAHHQDLSGARGGDGRGRRCPLKRGAAAVVAASKETGERREQRAPSEVRRGETL